MTHSKKDKTKTNGRLRKCWRDRWIDNKQMKKAADIPGSDLSSLGEGVDRAGGGQAGLQIHI